MAKTKAKAKEKNIFKRIAGWIFRSLIKLIFAFIVLSVSQVVFVRFVNPPFTVPMVTLWITNLFSSKKDVMPHHEWRYLKDISPSLVKAVMAGEDERFMSHHGFDLIELNKAYQDVQNNKIKRARGASTISMQLARTIFLWKHRDIVRKGLEAYYTVLLEFFLSKTRIMELYLNMVDWGTGIMGAEVASQTYYKISAHDLTDYQAAGMAAILPNPHKWSPTKPNRAARAHMDLILRYMGDMHL
jgi:monofunctional biosynthetic peptidoglycan transglycosylase